jgi:hypothetical protein
MIGELTTGATIVFRQNERLAVEKLVRMWLVLLPVSLFVAGCGSGGGSSNAPNSMSKPADMKMPADPKSLMKGPGREGPKKAPMAQDANK